MIHTGYLREKNDKLDRAIDLLGAVSDAGNEQAMLEELSRIRELAQCIIDETTVLEAS